LIQSQKCGGVKPGYYQKIHKQTIKILHGFQDLLPLKINTNIMNNINMDSAIVVSVNSHS